ncbi:transcription initiation factor TFIIE subunit beta [Nematocida sp. AWRm77]|nr:transcription initiation factor TFIIE subunit beta [Nematocida sp. AWRm77]
MDKSIYGKLSALPASSRHSNIYIHTIITLLKQHLEPLSFKEVEKQTGTSIEKTPGLLELLEKNKKIVIENKTLRFVPTYAISTEEELLSVLKETKSEHGIPLDELLDTNSNIKPFIDVLIEKNSAILLKDIDGSSILFYNSVHVSKVSPDILKLYDEVSVPDSRELARELSNAGLASKAVEKPVRKAAPLLKKKKYVRKIKITNTHLNEKELGM